MLKLVKRFGSPEAVFRASLHQLREVERLGSAVAEAIRGFGDHAWVERELNRMAQLGVDMLLHGREPYPVALAAVPDPPAFLFLRGRIPPGVRDAVAIVGSRAASQYGLSITHRLARDLAAHGITVVSGMARGIDSEAHRGALAVGGQTIAVLGSGLNVIYPPENRELFQRIVEGGAVVSEYPLDTQPDAVHFPARNRIISGLCLGTVIIEAAPQSGSLITANLALDQGREVFAVPGSVDSMRSRGTHQLIRQGARLVETARDILEELEPLLSRGAPPPGGAATPAEPVSEQEQRILELLGDSPLHIDQVIRGCSWSSSVTTGCLLQLELKGRIRQLPGKLFVRVG
jgi:DNA processing protein